MKKILFLVLTISILSCTSDEYNTNTQNQLKKLTSFNSSGEIDVVIDCEYNSDYMIQKTTTKYLYNDDTKITSYNYDSNNKLISVKYTTTNPSGNSSVRLHEFSYQENAINKICYFKSNDATVSTFQFMDKIEFDYDANGNNSNFTSYNTVPFVINMCDEINQTSSFTDLEHDSNGNLTKITNSLNSTYTKYYFGTSNHRFSNRKPEAYRKLMTKYSGDHNIIKMTRYSIVNNEELESYYYNYEFNDDNFPTSQIMTNSFNSDVLREEYEYY